MAVGTGIFLGFACLAAVILYTQTKDRWRWRSIAKWVALTVAAPIVVGSLWLGYSTIKNYLASRPKRVTTYAGISLGDTKEEVLYASGQPTEVEVDDAEGVPPGFRLDIKTSELPSGKRVADFQYWEYESAEVGRIDVDFSPDSQRVVRIFCYAGTSTTNERPCPVLVGVSAGATEEEVVKRLGTPSKAEISEGYVKTLYYSKWNVAFMLEKRRVYGLQIESGMATKAQQSHATGTKPPDTPGTKPPVECAVAKSADECADLLKKAGKNPFDAYGYAGNEPVYRRKTETAAPLVPHPKDKP